MYGVRHSMFSPSQSSQMAIIMHTKDPYIEHVLVGNHLRRQSSPPCPSQQPPVTMYVVKNVSVDITLKGNNSITIMLCIPFLTCYKGPTKVVDRVVQCNLVKHSLYFVGGA